jgi:serine phosphatase RsbU (regulator of sigma subunit)
MTAPEPEPGLTPGVRRVLVVDDDRDINRLIRVRLERRGYEVTTAASGEEALAILPTATPDLAFIDVSMPGMSGLDLLARIRSERLDIGVIMTTAFSSEQTAILAMRQGADDYLRKPFETAEFQVVLERTARRVALSRENRRLQEELDDKRRRLETEFASAREVQADLLPAAVPGLPGFELAARCIPAHEVGGDFYDWMVEGDYLTFILGDVMGKGMPAALLMASARAAFRTAASHHAPAEAIARVARALEADLLRSNRFLTFFLGQVHLPTGQLLYVDAGHGYACIARPGQGLACLKTGGPPFGAFEGQAYDQYHDRLGPGDTLLVYSDGLVEVDPRLDVDRRAEYQPPALSAGPVVAALTAAEHGADLPDDLTVLALHRLAEAPQP